MNAIQSNCLASLIALDKLDWVPELGDPDDSIFAIHCVDDRPEKVRKVKWALMSNRYHLWPLMPIADIVFHYVRSTAAERIYDDMCGPHYSSSNGYLAHELSKTLDRCVKIVEDSYGP